MLLLSVVFCVSCTVEPTDTGSNNNSGGGGTTVEKYSITYDKNGATGGTVPTDGNTYEAGATVTVSDKGTLVKTGCKFAGWDTSSAAATAVYSAGATFAMGSANVTLYAVWKPVYTVTYNLNSSSATGTAPTDSSEYAEGDTVTVKTMETEPTLNNYTFIGWATTADSVNGTYGDGSTFSMGSANVTLYAVWTKFTFTFSSGVYTTATYTGAETSVTVPGIIKGVSGTIIGENAFKAKYGLSSVTFGDGIGIISASAFESCSSLTTVTLPASITTIGDNAFKSCNSLVTIICSGTTPATLGTTSLSSAYELKIYVPTGYTDTYKTAWSAYSSKIDDIANKP